MEGNTPVVEKFMYVMRIETRVVKIEIGFNADGYVIGGIFHFFMVRVVYGNTKKKIQDIVV